MRSVIHNMIRWVRVTLGGTSGTQFPVQQTSYLGKSGDAVMWFAYGHHAEIPEDQGDGLGSLALQFSLGGNGETRVALPGSPTRRPELAAGEVAWFHPPTGTMVHFKADGSIEVTSDVSVTVSAPQITLGDAASVSTIGGSLDHDGTLAGFFGVPPVVRQSITGNNNTQTINSIVAAGVALGLWTDDR